MGLFLDLINVPVRQTNDLLEGLYKALSDGHGHGDDDSAWRPHESVLIRRLVELFTKRGLDRLQAVQDALLKWQSGGYHNTKAADSLPSPRPPGAILRWDAGEMALARVYLENLPPQLWTVDDHMMAVDLVVQTYLPADVVQSEAEWLAARSSLMGKVQANLDAEPTPKVADAILGAMPLTVAHAAEMFPLQAAQKSQLNFAKTRAVENVRALTESVRHKMRVLVAQDLEAKATGNLPAGTSSLETKLFDAFGELNRDWRRIAITEAGEAQLQGLVANAKPGTKLKRIEQYKDACSFCRGIHNKVVTVVDASAPKKDPDTEVWAGKNNIGRSAAPRKRVGNKLINRQPDEMWVIPAGLVHPNCRGRWIVESTPDEPKGDPDFAKWLDDNLS